MPSPFWRTCRTMEKPSSLGNITSRTITSNVPALVEVTRDVAIHVEAKSVAAISDAMTRVMRDESLRAAMIERGLMRAREFTWRRCAEMTLEIYRRIT